MLYALDLETCCNVSSCPDYGKSVCRADHSLSPWHGRITQLACWAEGSDYAVVHGDEQAVALAQALMDDGAVFVGHAFKFDLLWLSVKAPELAERLREAWVADTNLMAFVHTKKITDQWIADYVANAPPGNRKAGKHSLKTLAPYFLGVEPYWESTAGGHESEEYVLKDVEYTYRLYQYMRANLSLDELQFVDDKLLPWAKMCLEAELAGMRLDVEGLLAYQEELRAKESALRAQLDELWTDAHAAYHNIQLAHVHIKYDAMKLTKAREPRREVALSRVATQVSYDSPTQMHWLLADFYGYDIRSIEGHETTDKEVLSRLANEGHDDVRTYLKWRKTQKVLSSFIPGLLSHCDDRGYVHPILNVTKTEVHNNAAESGAKTGRLSCERPNLQQTPKELKRFFLPDEGEVMIGYDAKAIEAKLIGIYTEDPKICEIVLSGASFHDNNAKEFFGLECPVEEVSKAYPKERRAAKTIGFAGLYGAGANRIRISFTKAGFPVSTGEAKRIYSNYRRAYSTAFERAGEVVTDLEQGETINNLLGRPVHFDNPDEVYMQGFNRLIQGSASDYNMHAAFEAIKKLREAGIPAKPRLFIHDYIGASVPKQHAVEADKIALEALCAMRLTTSYGVINLDYEGGISDGWE